MEKAGTRAEPGETEMEPQTAAECCEKLGRKEGGGIEQSIVVPVLRRAAEGMQIRAAEGLHRRAAEGDGGRVCGRDKKDDRGRGGEWC